MDVLLLAPSMSGGEGVYTKLIQAAAPDGVKYSVSDGFHKGAPGAPCSRPLEIGLNRLIHPLGIPDIGFRALRLRRRFDLVHVHAHPVRLAGIGATPLVMSEGASSVVYLRDYLGWDQRRLKRGLRRTRRLYRALGIRDRLLTLERVTRAYVFSEWARDLNVRWGADPEKLEVVPPGFPVRDVVARSESDDFTFVFVGGDFERKGGFDVVEAFAEISYEYPGARLVIAGSDPAIRNPDRLVHEWVPEQRRNRVLRTLEGFRQQRRVVLMGRVGAADVHARVYPSADAFVMPTLAEGFGFANVEAMSYGLPVVSTNVGPIAEIVDDEVTGLLVAPSDVDGLVSAMRRLISDPERARRMGERARVEFLGKYTLDRFRDRLKDVYSRAVAS